MSETVYNQKCVFVTASLLGEVSRYTLISKIIEGFAHKNVEFRILEYRAKEPSDIALAKEKGLVDATISIRPGFQNNLHLLSILYLERPHIIMIGGYGHLANWLALFYAVITRRCIVLWSGAGTESHKNKGCFYRFFKRLFVSKVHRFISYGSSAYRYLVSLGVQPEKIRKAVNVSDIDFFKSIPTSDSIVKAERVIREFLPHSKNVRILLFVGQMNRRKGVDVLVKELSLLEQHRYFCHFVGEGPLAQDVQRAITDGSISGFFWGKLTREHVRELMHNSDVYVLPTRFDPFSRTLSEAIASGCYCLNSVFDDATEDLLVEGVNGESFNPSVRGELFRCLCKVTQQDFLLPNKESIRATLRNSTEDYASCVINSVFDSMGVDI